MASLQQRVAILERVSYCYDYKGFYADYLMLGIFDGMVPSDDLKEMMTVV